MRRLARLAVAALQGTAGLLLAACFFFPFLVFSAIVAARHPGPAACTALGLLVVSAALLFGIGQMWGSRQAAFRMLHDFLYRFRALPLREYTVEDYIDRYDPRIREALFQFRDLRTEPASRTHRLRVFFTEDRDSAGSRDPVAYVNPAALGMSYIVLKVPPEEVNGVGWFTVLHELGHARPHHNPIYLHLLLGRAPYAIAALCALPLLSRGWLSLVAAGGMLLALRWLGPVHQATHAANRLFEEVSADGWALELLKPADRARLRDLLARSPNVMARDDTIPEPLRGVRRLVLIRSLERLEEGGAPVALDWWRFFPWRVPALGFAAVAALALTSGPPGLWTAVVPAGLVLTACVLALSVVLASHRHLEQEVDYHLRFTGVMSGLRGVLESAEYPAVIPDYLRVEGAEVEKLQDAHVYDEHWSSMVVDAASRFGFPGLVALRVSRWVNVPETTARREMAGVVWSGGRDQLRALRVAFQGAMRVERRPHRILALSRLRSWFEVTLARTGGHYHLLIELAESSGLPESAHEAARNRVRSVLDAPAEAVPALVTEICRSGEAEATLFQAMLALAAKDADEAACDRLLYALQWSLVVRKNGGGVAAAAPQPVSTV